MKTKLVFFFFWWYSTKSSLNRTEYILLSIYKEFPNSSKTMNRARIGQPGKVRFALHDAYTSIETRFFFFLFFKQAFDVVLSIIQSKNKQAVRNKQFDSPTCKRFMNEQNVLFYAISDSGQ